MFLQVSKNKHISIDSISSIELIGGNYVLITKAGPVHVHEDYVENIKRLLNKQT